MVAEYTGGQITRYRAEYFHQDHLGNTRLVFSDFNQNGIVDLEEDDPATPLNELEITQESHYYPFGMNHLGPWYETVAPENKYLYNGKELNADYEINLYEYGARWYGPAVGRFTGVDPIAEEFPHLSVYNYASNDPVRNIDLHGLQGVPYNMIVDVAAWFGKNVLNYENYDYEAKQEEYDFDHKYDEGLLGPVDANYGNQNTTEALGGSAENAATVAEIPLMADGVRSKSPKGSFSPKFATSPVDDFSANVSITIHKGKQGKHISGHNNYQEGKSILTEMHNHCSMISILETRNHLRLLMKVRFGWTLAEKLVTTLIHQLANPFRLTPG